MKHITLKQIANACNGKYYGDSNKLDAPIDGIAIDNRLIKKDYLFIPIIGERFDGHTFIKPSFENGAVCCLTEQKIADDNNYIKVESTFQALKDIAEFYRSLFDVKIIGITGSVGKTTTKEFVYSVLSQKYNVHKSAKNFNNEIGVPLTLFELDDSHDYAIIEMGMNHFGEISRLSKTARPNICVIVNIDYTHVGNLGSRRGVFKAKTEIFDYAKEGFTAYLNGDDDLLYTLKDKAMDKTYFGFEDDNDIIAKNIVPLGLNGTNCTIEFEGKSFDIHINKPGRHLLYSAMVACAIGINAGLNEGEIVKGIQSFEPVGKRMDVIKTDKITILNDVYNASPKSVKAALDVLREAKARKVCILGDMLELGDYAEKLHSEVGSYAGDIDIDLVICAGEQSEHTKNGAVKRDGNTVWFKSQDEMIDNLKDLIQKGDVVLVKASRGMKFEKTVEQLKLL